MREFATDTFGDEDLRTLWLNRLLSTRRGILFVSVKSDLNILAEIADNIMENLANDYVMVVETQNGAIEGLGRKVENHKTNLAMFVQEFKSTLEEIRTSIK